MCLVLLIVFLLYVCVLLFMLWLRFVSYLINGCILLCQPKEQWRYTKRFTAVACPSFIPLTALTMQPCAPRSLARWPLIKINFLLFFCLGACRNCNTVSHAKRRFICRWCLRLKRAMFSLTGISKIRPESQDVPQTSPYGAVMFLWNAGGYTNISKLEARMS